MSIHSRGIGSRYVCVDLPTDSFLPLSSDRLKRGSAERSWYGAELLMLFLLVSTTRPTFCWQLALYSFNSCSLCCKLFIDLPGVLSRLLLNIKRQTSPIFTRRLTPRVHPSIFTTDTNQGASVVLRFVPATVVPTYIGVAGVKTLELSCFFEELWVVYVTIILPRNKRKEYNIYTSDLLILNIWNTSIYGIWVPLTTIWTYFDFLIKYIHSINETRGHFSFSEYHLQVLPLVSLTEVALLQHRTPLLNSLLNDMSDNFHSLLWFSQKEH